jgi:hypothetical protein
MNRRELITGALATGAGTVLVSNSVSANSPEATDVPRRQQPDQLMGRRQRRGTSANSRSTKRSELRN